MSDRNGFLSGKKILVVDDEPLLAHDLADHVQGYGASVVGPCHTVADAMHCLDRDAQPLDFALLDIQLGLDLVWPLADRLRAEGTPIIFISAHCHTGFVLDRFRDAPCLTKPVDHARLNPLMAELFEIELKGP